MGIAFLFALGVVLAVNGNPFLGDHAGGHPEPETEEVHDGRMEIQAAVRLAGDGKMVRRHNRDARHNQDEHDAATQSLWVLDRPARAEAMPIHRAVRSLASEKCLVACLRQPDCDQGFQNSF